MKKVLFAAFAGMCVISSIMATSANTGTVKGNPGIDQIIRDTVPGKKSDTSSYPKRDTARLSQDQKK
jgi:hypothetical protein